MRTILNDKVLLITGGTGSFGKKFTEILFKKYKYKSSYFPVANNSYNRTIALPLYPTLKNSDILCVVKTFKEILE